MVGHDRWCKIALAEDGIIDANLTSIDAVKKCWIAMPASTDIPDTLYRKIGEWANPAAQDKLALGRQIVTQNSLLKSIAP